jgi:imidazolonepropionase-like amidohydrolase
MPLPRAHHRPRASRPAAILLTAIAAAATLALPAHTAHAQDLVVRAPAQSQPVVIVNATIHTISGPTYDRGFIYFEQGIIKGLGNGAPPAFDKPVQTIDATGKHVYPGMIAAYTQTGLTEIASVRASRDFQEIGEVKPEVWAAVSVNPDSTIIPVTRQNGVLAVGTFPTGGLIPGRASVIRLEGWTWEDLAVKRDAGTVIAWPFMRAVNAPWMDRPEDDQRRDIARNLDRLKETLRAAKAYIAAKDAPPSPATPPTPPTDLRYEALRGILGKGRPAQGQDPGDHQAKLPAFVEAADYDQITSAVAFAVENQLNIVIVGGRDAHLCAPLLKQHNIPVIFNSTLLMPKRDDSPYDDVYASPKKLHDAGVRFAISSGEETPHERNLPYAAAIAVAHGLPQDAALNAITLAPAQILGVDDTLGSLDIGKEATLFIADNNPLEITTNIESIYIRGKLTPLQSKQSDLAAKYREKYRQSGQLKNQPQPATPPAK